MRLLTLVRGGAAVIPGALIGAVLIAPALHGQVAQAGDQKKLAFEVASIKRNMSVDTQQALEVTGWTHRSDEHAAADANPSRLWLNRRTNHRWTELARLRWLRHRCEGTSRCVA